ncbi:hypothetical protein HY970_01850 [Candidatus Kaiserbacteria bacterium]|nr:hypothetical protein [Candidatus Kaiserbacteria bacterium]
MLHALKKWRHDKNYLIHEVTLARWVVFFLMIGVFAGSWDIWWHISIGRENLFIPPHLMIYLSTGLTILAGIYGWFKTRERLWKRLAIFLCFVPLLAPFDEAWHRIFGIENLMTPMILWSPPHMALGLVYLVSFIFIYPLVHDTDQSLYGRWLFSGLALVSIFGTIFVFTSPFDPYGPYDVLGYYGTFVYGILVTAMLLVASRFLHGTGSATFAAALFLVIYSIIAGNITPGPGILLPAYFQPPTWIQVGAFMSAAIIIDFTTFFPTLLRALISGSVWAFIYYGVAVSFMPATAAYTAEQAMTAVVCAIIGALITGICAPRVFRWLERR